MTKIRQIFSALALVLLLAACATSPFEPEKYEQWGTASAMPPNGDGAKVVRFDQVESGAKMMWKSESDAQVLKVTLPSDWNVHGTYRYMPVVVAVKKGNRCLLETDQIDAYVGGYTRNGEALWEGWAYTLIHNKIEGRNPGPQRIDCKLIGR